MLAQCSLLKLIIIILSLLTLKSHAQEGREYKRYLKDYNQLVDMIIREHPDPFAAITREEFEDFTSNAKKEIVYVENDVQFFRICLSTISLLKDGHSRVFLPETILKKWDKEEGFFPFIIHLDNDNRCYVIRSFEEKPSIPEGAEILSINGLSIREFVDKVDPWISYEVEPFRNVTIENEFELYLYLVFGSTNNLKIRFRQLNEEEVSIQNFTQKEWKSKQKKSPIKIKRHFLDDKPQLYYNKVSDEIGYLRIASFRVYSYYSFAKFLKEVFNEIERTEVRSLIIDLRGNFGGRPEMAMLLLNCISELNFEDTSLRLEKVNSKENRKIKTLQVDSIVSKIDSVSVHDLKYDEGRDLAIILRDSNVPALPRDSFFQNYCYNGETYLLTDRCTYSASSTFAAAFQCFNLGTIIGEATGGTKIFHAYSRYEELKKTRIEVRVSTTKFLTACYNEENLAIQPDIEVKPTILDLLHNNDSVLNFTQQLIRRQRKNK